MIDAVRNAMRLPDLRNKILFTLLILVIYRLAAHIPVPNVNADALRSVFSQNSLLGFLDLFSGGAFANFSVVAMGVYPLITAQIIIQLATGIIPQLEQMVKEGGEAGKAKLNLWTHLLTIPLAALQAFAQAFVLTQQGNPPPLQKFGFAEYPIETISVIITLTAGTVFAIWLGELITEQGIGSGISIIIFGGIVAGIPQRVGQLIQTNPLRLIEFLAVTLITIVGIIFIQEGHRRIPVQYSKQVRGNKMYGGQSTHIPLRINSSGMIPLILAISILIFPGVLASPFAAPAGQPENFANWIVNAFNQQSPVYWIVYFVMVLGLTYFYTDVVFRQQNIPEMLQRQGGFIPGIRPGKKTEDYLNGVVQRITLVGALFLGLVAILPFLMRDPTESTTMLITSTGMLIIVGVVLDTMKQLQAQLLMRHYEGFIK